MATLVTNTGQAAVTLPAPYSTTLASSASVSLVDNVPLVYARLRQTVPAAQFSFLVFSVDPTSAASASVAATSQATTTGTTKITNISSASAMLPAPYSVAVAAGGFYVTTDSVSVAAGYLATLPASQQALWSVSVVSPTSSEAVVAYGPLDLHGQRAINAANPIEASDLTTKAYVDAAIAAAPATQVTMGGDVLGQSSAATVAKIQGRAVSNTAPNSGQVLGWNGTSWAPTNQSGGGGASTVTLPTTATLNPGECVAVDPATGQAVRAKPTEPQKMPAVGVVQSATAEEVVVQLTGPKSGYLGMTPGAVYFVSRSGAPDASLPGPGAQIQIIGVAVSATTMLINPSFPTVQRSA